jgi:2-polyprenyl-3-methyl-5-hydroxy-6-metoxy-1,4-benzoquinol methylase
MSDEELLQMALAALMDSWATFSIPARLEKTNYDTTFAGGICRLAFEKSGRDVERYKKALGDFIMLSEEFVRLQMELDKTGKYRYSSFEEVRAIVYDNPEVMEGRYLNGLLLSQAFWTNHARMYAYFVREFCDGVPATGRVFEVPSGTGLFITEFASRNPSWEATGTDLSNSSVEYTRDIARLRNVNVTVTSENIFDLSGQERYDRLICGELLEHLENPEELLSTLHRLTAPAGKVFLTTAIWAASIDHIYLFQAAREVRAMLEKHFTISSELVLPVFDGFGPEDAKTPINYASILLPK